MSGFFNSLRSLASGAANVASGAAKSEDDEGQDTRMKFSLNPQPGKSGFIQWLDAMKMVAKLKGGIPTEFRKKLWLTLAERHLEQRGVDWRQAEKLCFNEWSNPDDDELGIQIVKDLHRTGCSLFCGAAGRDNQAVLRRVLLGFARWNKSVGYCQGLNVLAALILQVVDRDEGAAVKVMIHLIEGVLPEGYFADNLKGLSVDMAVFRDLLRMRLPRLSKHLESLQNDAKDKATGTETVFRSSYEPPLTNVFTMQWFLTLFCHCLPQDAVLRVWDLIFLEGDDVLLRTALAIWEGLSDRILTVTSADEFYSIMGVLTREMLEFTDTNHLIKTIVNMGLLHGITNLRVKHRYNITPWTRKLSDDDDSDTEDDERLAVAAAAAIFAAPRNKKSDRHSIQSVATPSSDRERLALDISTLKQQYAKLRERQRQAHIILSAACARQSMVTTSSATQAMNHLLVGKSALVSSKNRPIGPPTNSLVARAKAVALQTNPRSQTRKDRQQQGITIHWKDMKKHKDECELSSTTETSIISTDTLKFVESPHPGVAATSSITKKWSSSLGAGGTAVDSDSDSTSTELCDEPDRLSDVDSEELTSISDYSPRKSLKEDKLISGETIQDSTFEHKDTETSNHTEFVTTESSIAEITDQIRRLSADDADFQTSLDDVKNIKDTKSLNSKLCAIDDNIKEKHLIDDISLNSNFFNEGKASIDLELSSKDKFAEDNKLSTSTIYNVDHSKEKSKSISFPISVQHTSAGANIGIKSTSIVEIPNQKSNILESKSADTNRTEYTKCTGVGNIANSANDLVSVGADRTSDIELNTPQVNYSTKSSYVIGHLPIAPMNFEIRNNNNSVPTDVLISRDDADTIRSRLEQQVFSSNMDISVLSSTAKFSTYKMQVESKYSPKTPESIKSITSGETMGPDSIMSSVVISPKTPLYFDSHEIMLLEKSIASSISSESKTLTIDSIECEILRKQVEGLDEKFASPSTDSLLNTKSNDHHYSSTDSFCSSGKFKSSDRTSSSELQSPISTTSIKYTTNYSYKCDDEEPKAEIISVISPFYPILNPNKKTPSPIGDELSGTNKEVNECNKFRGIIQNEDPKKYYEKTSITQAFDISQYKITEENINPKILFKNDSLHDNFKHSYNKLENSSTNTMNNISIKNEECNLVFDKYRKAEFDNDLQDIDTLSPLPSIQFDHCSSILERKRGSSFDGKIETLQISDKSYDRNNSSLEKIVSNSLSPSMDSFTSNVKKRSSDILEDLRHLESKTTNDGEINPDMLTKKTSFIWEDLKILEARRQDTFSDSANSFSRQRIDVSGISISVQGHKSYVVEPKINIDDNSDSILKAITYKSSNGTDHADEDEQNESKLGVWTKVKPRKRSDSGRRSSDRALKIIQENSVILQKILTCQARKRLPDLEEISKEITISPINEEISKIFSPILEKMGLNEEEINEELAKINFKDLDRNTTTTTASEFDTKINDELSKLSLIGDNDEVAYLPDVDDLSSDYLVARDAFIDHQINEELSRLLANYEEHSPSISVHKGALGVNVSDDLSTLSNNHSYEPLNTTVDMKKNHNYKEIIQSFNYTQNSPSYMSQDKYVTPHNFSIKNNTNVYNQHEQILYTESVSNVNPKIESQDIISSSVAYISDIVNSPKLDYSSSLIENKQNYDTSSLNSMYNNTYSSSTIQTSNYDYKSRISPRKTPSNPYSVRSYDLKNNFDTGYENSTFEINSRKIIPQTLNSEYTSTKHILSKENLEFQLKCNQNNEITTTEKLLSQNVDLNVGSFQVDNTKFNSGIPYYSNNESIIPIMKYDSNKDNQLSLITTNESSYQCKMYDNVSPEKYSSYTENYDKPRYSDSTSSLMKSEPQISSYLSNTSISTVNCHQNIAISSPQYHCGDYQKVTNSSFSTISANFDNSLAKVTTSAVTMTAVPNIGYTSTFIDQSYKTATLTVNNFQNNQQIIDNTKYNFDQDPNSRIHGFSSFSSRNSLQKPKELTLKLGLYSPTKSLPLNKS